MTYLDQTAEIKYITSVPPVIANWTGSDAHTNLKDSFVLSDPYSLWIDGVFFLNREVDLVIQNWEHPILFIESVHHRAQLVIRTWDRKLLVREIRSDLSVREINDAYVICYWRWLQIYYKDMGWMWMKNEPNSK